MKVYEFRERYTVHVGLDEPVHKFDSEEEALAFMESESVKDKNPELIIQIYKRIRLS